MSENNQENPSQVKMPFLRARGLISKLNPFKQGDNKPIVKELGEPLLFLMKENGYMEILENVRAGEFVINTPAGEKAIMLTPDKITTLKYGEQYYKAWVAYENCASAYPENPLHTSEMFRKVTQKLAMNWRDRDESKLLSAKGKMWLYILGGVGLLIVLLGSLDPAIWSSIIGGGGQAAADTATNVAQNLTQNVTEVTLS